MINILIGGDICPINRNKQYFINGDIKKIYNDLLDEFINADISIINLECPLVNDGKPIDKIGPIYGVEKDCIKGLSGVPIDIVNLANNHILDFDVEGLMSTIKACNENGIKTVGAGINIIEARRAYIVEIKGLKIGFMGVADREFSIATNSKGGANPLDLTNIIPDILSLKKKVDHIILLLHTGFDRYPYPSPNLMKLCRMLVELGVMCVVCQHSHCPGTYEVYNDGYIIYGQGNLIFDIMAKQSDIWNQGFLVKLIINEMNKKHNVEFIPYLQSDISPGLCRMRKDIENEFLLSLYNRSEELMDEGKIENRWRIYCKYLEMNYLNMVMFNNRIFKRFNNILHFDKLIFSKRKRLLLSNLFRSEVHREILEKIFSDKTID